MLWCLAFRGTTYFDYYRRLNVTSLLDFGRCVFFAGVHATGRSATVTIVKKVVQPTCTPLAVVAKDFTILLAAAEAAGLLGALADLKASLTIFAPTDEAFAWFLKKNGLTLEAILANKEILAVILSYHVLAVPIKSSKLALGLKLETLLTPAVSPCGKVSLLSLVCWRCTSCTSGDLYLLLLLSLVWAFCCIWTANFDNSYKC